MSSAMSVTSETTSKDSFSSAAFSETTTCPTCGEAIDQPAAFVHQPFFCSRQCEGVSKDIPPPISGSKNRSTLNILHSNLQVFPGIHTPAFKQEFETRLGFIKAWAAAEHSLSIYTMDSAPWKDMIDHEHVSPWANPRDYHTYALKTAYNMAHHDECDGLYMEACTSLLGAIIRIFLMWDLTQLGIARSKLVGISFDQDRSTLLRGEDVITVPDQLLDGELLQIAWTWPNAVEAAVKATVENPNPLSKDVGTFIFDRSHWTTVIEVIRKVSGAVWED